MADRWDDRNTALAERRREMRPEREPEGDDTGMSTRRMVVGLVTIGAALGIGYLLMKNAPDVRRYLRIRAM